MAELRLPQVQDRETVWAHADPDCRGPVYFEIAGGWCYRCGAGPLLPTWPPEPYPMPNLRPEKRYAPWEETAPGPDPEFRRRAAEFMDANDAVLRRLSD